MSVNLRTLYDEARSRLRRAGIDNPALDARTLVRAALGVTDAELITGPDIIIPGEQSARLESFLRRREEGEPVSRILGSREFWGLDFLVTPAVLDPRPDTETLIESVLTTLSPRPPATILDLGTGSGCIIITLLRAFPQAKGVAVDLSEQALDVARMNAQRLGVTDRLTLIKGSWFENVTGQFDLIVSNPPYIPRPDIESLAREVRNHDPILALAGGEDGYDAYKAIIGGLKNFAAPGAYCFLEIGINQGENVARLAEDSNLSVCRIILDIAGIPRTVEIYCGDK